jgi:RNA polymerase sigma-70 factor (ECF subfamily)
VVASYQPYWALRAHLLRREGAVDWALTAYNRAIGLSESPAVRNFLSREAATVKELMR